MAYSLTVVLLSGAIATGKTTLARSLGQMAGVQHVSTSGLLSATAGRELSRSELQQAGTSARLQAGGWISEAVRQAASNAAPADVVVVDAVRTLEQVSDLRTTAAGQWRILHVHLRGNAGDLAARHDAGSRRERGTSWEQAMRASTEAAVASLEAEADVVADTTVADPAELAVRVLARIDRTWRSSGHYADVLVGGQWGSEGKGHLAFFLAPEYDLLVRTGAPNAGHKICGRNGRVYTHRQLPSGTTATDSLLLLGAGAVIDIGILLREIGDCQVQPGRLAVDLAALIIEDRDIAAETALKSAIGSTGTGGGAAQARRITQRGIPGAIRQAKDIEELQPYVRETAEVLEQARRRGGRVLLEGTQGTGLSIVHGTYPHVTSRDTTATSVLAESGVPPQMLRRVVVALRAYPIRVGGPSGPMGREISWETVARRSGLDGAAVKASELGSVSGNQRRVAEFSWAQLRESARLNGATDLALTFADYLDARNRRARRYSQLTAQTTEFIAEMETVAQAPVSLISTGFDERGPIDRRHW